MNRNTIPLPASVVLDALIKVRNTICRLTAFRPFYHSIISSIAHVKKKERIALALRIKKSSRPTQPCSFCKKQARRCLLNKSESSRCSECVRSKRSCDFGGYHEVVIYRPIYYFFCGLRPKKILLTSSDFLLNPPLDFLTS